jgi:hypothetical protein
MAPECLSPEEAQGLFSWMLPVSTHTRPSILLNHVALDLVACCFDCKHYHEIHTPPHHLLESLAEWDTKHYGHDIAFLPHNRTIPRGFDDSAYEASGIAPYWDGWTPNANIKIEYAASAAMTCTLASLPSSSTFTSGREATSIDNTSNKYIDYRVSPKITVGTSPTAGTEIRLYSYVALNDTPVYPDTLSGADANVTLTESNMLDCGFVLLGGCTISGTSNIGYPIKCLTIAEAHGHAGHRWGLYITHNTGVNLHATAGNHVITQKAAYYTSI